MLDGVLGGAQALRNLLLVEVTHIPGVVMPRLRVVFLVVLRCVLAELALSHTDINLFVLGQSFCVPRAFFLTIDLGLQPLKDVSNARSLNREGELPRFPFGGLEVSDADNPMPLLHRHGRARWDNIFGYFVVCGCEKRKTGVVRLIASGFFWTVVGSWKSTNRVAVVRGWKANH